MARLDKDIEELARRIEALPATSRKRLFERVLTPEEELDLVIEQIHRETRRLTPPQRRELDRAIDQAVEEVRREHHTRGSRRSA